jgi:hypothetical protein
MQKSEAKTSTKRLGTGTRPGPSPLPLKRSLAHLVPLRRGHVGQQRLEPAPQVLVRDGGGGQVLVELCVERGDGILQVGGGGVSTRGGVSQKTCGRACAFFRPCPCPHSTPGTRQGCLCTDSMHNRPVLGVLVGVGCARAREQQGIGRPPSPLSLALSHALSLSHRVIDLFQQAARKGGRRQRGQAGSPVGWLCGGGWKEAVRVFAGGGGWGGRCPAQPQSTPKDERVRPCPLSLETRMRAHRPHTELSPIACGNRHCCWHCRCWRAVKRRPRPAAASRERWTAAGRMLRLPPAQTCWRPRRSAWGCVGGEIRERACVPKCTHGLLCPAPASARWTTVFCKKKNCGPKSQFFYCLGWRKESWLFSGPRRAPPPAHSTRIPPPS